MRHLRSVVVSLTVCASAITGIAADAGPAAADPPANGRIAYVHATSEADAGIWTINPDGSGETRIVPSTPEVGVTTPEWSPDGSRLGFVSMDMSTWEASVSSVAPDGTGRVDLALPVPWQPALSELVWSPDGSRLALPVVDYQTDPEDDPTAYAIAIVPTNGAAPVLVQGPPLEPAAGPDLYMHLEWSPDGSTLAFARAMFAVRVASVAADGTGYTSIADYSGAPSHLHVGGPTWLDPSRLAVGTRTMANPCCSGETGSIWGVDSDGSDAGVILADAGLYNLSDVSWQPGWPQPRTSPDRSRLALRGGGYGSGPYGEPIPTGLWVLDVDGTDAHEIAPYSEFGDTIPENFDWSPDSQFVVWADSNDYAGSSTGLLLRRADGSGPIVPIGAGGYVSQPKWAPVPPPAAQDHVTIHVSGKYSYHASADLSGGNLEVRRSSDGAVAAVSGVGQYPGVNGGTATIAVNARRFWILPLYTGTTSVSDPSAPLSVSYPLLFAGIARTATGATWTSSWFDFSRWPWGSYSANITVDDIT